jgi:surface protein
MKHFYIFLFTTFFSLSALAQNAPFITTWEVTPGSLDITIPTTGTGYNYTVDFGDGTVQSNVTGDATHTYNAPGIYTVSISGDFPRIYFRKFTNINTAMLLKIKSVDQWGDIQWQSMEFAFTECSNLVVNATDAPDLSQVNSMNAMFKGATSFNQSIAHWDVSSVTEMNGVFKNASSFNQPLDNWNVSNVTSMGDNVYGGMFEGATSFNQPLNSWNVSNVTKMDNLFYNATSFNQSLDNWNTSQVISMAQMFRNASSFNKSINSWNVSNVNNMSSMFENASSFDQPLDNWSPVSVYSMQFMFKNAKEFNQSLQNWNVLNLSSMQEMFNGATSFNQNLSGWTFHPGTYYSNFVSYSGLDISNYEALLARFNQLGIQNNTLGAHDLFYCNEVLRNELVVNKGWTIQGDILYNYCNNIDSFITEWEVTQNDLTITIPTTGTGYDYDIDFGDGTILNNITGNTTHTYSQPGSYTVIITGDFPRIFFNNSGDKNKIKKILQWGSIEWHSMENAFSGCSNLEINALDTPDLSMVTNMSSMFFEAAFFNSPINNWDVSNVTDMSNMFHGATLFNQPLDKWNVSNVTNMTNMFYEATLFNNNISTWNFNNTVNLSGFIVNSGLSVTNYDNLLTRFEQLGLQNKTLNADSLFYCNSTSRNELINNLSWNILGDSLYSLCSNLDAFITTWEVTAGSLDIIIPTQGAGYNYTVDFGDGTVHHNVSGDITHIYNAPGIYTVSISGDFPRIYFFKYYSNNSNASKIKSVEQWGNIEWTSMESAFWQCDSLVINAVDAPDLTKVTSMNNMFRNAFLFNQSINHWDVSNVQNISGMFYNAVSFNQPLDYWDVSNINDMSHTFEGAVTFNQPLNNWDVSNVNTMTGMFDGATSFNQPLNNWDVSNVTYFKYMFNNAVYFNQDLSNWIFKTNANIDSYSAINDGGFIFNSGLDAGNYTALLNRFATLGIQRNELNAHGMFYCDPTDRNILRNTLNWDITGDRYMVDCNPILDPDAFIAIWDSYGSITIPTVGSGYNYNIDFGDGNVYTNVTGSISHSYTQPGCYYVSITGDFPRIYFNDTGDKNKIIEIVQWGDIEWQSMEKAFSGCSNLRVYATDSPDLSLTTNMSYMFENASLFNQDINHWDVSGITNMKGLFNGAEIYNMPLNNWDVSSVTNMSEMFREAYEFNRPLNNWNVSNVTNMHAMFYKFFSFDTTYSFNQDINNWDVSKVTDMSYMFYGSRFFNKPLNNWDVSSVTNMEGMFLNATFFNQSLDNWDVSNVTNMSHMFYGLWSFNQPLNTWDVSSVENMNGMFRSTFYFNQPLNDWDVSNVTNLGSMFRDTNSFNQPLNDWDISNVTSLSNMFKEAKAFNQPLNDWNTSSVTIMTYMFEDAKEFNQPLYNWDVSNVIGMSNTFNNAVSFNQDISSWNFNQSIVFNQFLSGTAMDIPNYDALLARFVNLGLQNKIFGAKDLFFCNEVDRDYLVTNLGWVINGDNLSLDCNFIIGSIVYDEPNDGCDPNDIAINGFRLDATDGIHNFSTFSDSGIYNLGVMGSSFTVSIPNTPSYFTVSPASANVTFSGSNTETLDFCVTANQSTNDLNITLLPPNEARPGFEADYRLVIRNVGTETIPNVDATLQFDDSMQQFVSANPAPTTTTTNTLTFSVGTLQPFQKFEVEITMLTFQPPTVNGGDILNFTADVTPVANDFTPTDNTYTLAQVVVNSYDPNDKQVLQGEELHIDKTDDYLDYLIRFQNTGTASAINVRILDTLHPKLDWNTFVPISASHDYYIKIKDGNHVEFMFDNIHLPDSISNEPESHGYVAYKIRPKSDVQVGDVITGDAAIYFDFNPPIITNTVETLIVESLDVDDFTASAPRILIYPNPADDVLNIHASGVLIKELILYDIQGRKIQQFEGNRDSIDVSRLNSGIYFIKINTDKGSFTKRVSKK